MLLATRDTAMLFRFLTTGLSPSLVPLSTASSNVHSHVLLSHDPNGINHWFRLVPFRSPLLWESLLISLPQATKMFQFAWFALSDLWIQSGVHGVAPFGHLRIDACFQLPEAFRR